jgi:hypothetical protein
MRFEINGKEYSARQMDAFTQFHVARRLTPILSNLAGGLDLDPGKVKIITGEAGEVTGFDYDGDAQELLAPFAAALTCLSDADAEYIFNKFLEFTECKVAGTWSPMRQQGQTMIQPDLQELLGICAHGFEANLANFTKSLPPLSGLLGKLMAPVQRNKA